MAQNDIDEIYRDKVILDHCRNPRNQTPLKSPDKIGNVINPFCGDEVHMEMNFDVDGNVSDVCVVSEGCAINQASSSILSESVKGVAIEELFNLHGKFTSIMKGDEISKWLYPNSMDKATLNELSAMYSVRKFPVRIKCVLLSWSALLQIAIEA